MNQIAEATSDVYRYRCFHCEGYIIVEVEDDDDRIVRVYHSKDGKEVELEEV